MAPWMIALGGLLFWTLHFAGLYALSSLADLSRDPGAAGWRLAALGLSAACIGGAAVMLWASRRTLTGPPPLKGFMASIAAGSVLMGMAAMAFQTLAALL